MKQKSLWILVLSWIPQVFFVRYCQQHPQWVQAFYSQKFYPNWQALRTEFFDRWTISLGDLLYILCLITTLGLLWLHGKKAIHYPLKTSFSCLALLAVLHAFFQLGWGLNYYQEPLSKTLNLPKSYTDWELEQTTYKVMQRLHALHSQLVASDSVQVGFPKENKAYLTLTDQGTAKASLWSLPLSYMGYAGYLNPFTGEAQVNDQLPTLALITTVAHEQAHQTGLAAENEANFQAFLTTSQHPDPYIRFAGFSFAFRYCWSALYQRDPDCATELAEDLHPGIKKDFLMLQEFWQTYQNPFQPWINRLYDQFLKANGQSQGVESYNQVVAFIINYEENF